MMIFGFKERPRHFFSDPRPRRGRHVLAPRDPSDPATLPTLAPARSATLIFGGAALCLRARRLIFVRAFCDPCDPAAPPRVPPLGHGGHPAGPAGPQAAGERAAETRGQGVAVVGADRCGIRQW